MTPTPRPPDPDDRTAASAIEAAILSGRKIEAIKLYREQTGLGLAESKTAIDQLEAELRRSAPERFARPSGRGCTATVATLLLVVGLFTAVAHLG